MKSLITYFAACAMAAAASLNPGDAVKPDAIGAATFLKGEAPKEWGKDQVYILECWATWCGPCIQAIPHVNELHNKFKDKGLNIIGMNVWEDDKAKVEKFVTDKGDGMAYAVAFVGKEGAFETEWLKPAGVRGIPHAFVVKNGKFLFSTHPSGLTEELIADLLAGGEKEEAAVKNLQNAGAAKDKIQGFMMEKLMPLMQAKDFEKAAAAVNEFIAENPSLDDDTKAGLSLNASIMGPMEQGDYEAAAKAIDEIAAKFPKSRIGKEADNIKNMVKKQIEARKGAQGGNSEDEQEDGE